MEVLYNTLTCAELVKGISKKSGKEFLAVRIGDVLIFDNRLVNLLTVKYMSEVK